MTSLALTLRLLEIALMSAAAILGWYVVVGMWLAIRSDVQKRPLAKVEHDNSLPHNCLPTTSIRVCPAEYIEAGERVMMQKLAARNDASQTVKPGSDATVFAKPSATGGSCFGSGPSPVRALIIALSLVFATSIPCQGQEPSAGPLVDGGIREAIQELRETRKAQQELTAEAREWRGWFSRFDGSRVGKFADRIGTLVWLTFITAIVGLVAYCLRQVADVLKAFKGLFGKQEAKE